MIKKKGRKMATETKESAPEASAKRLCRITDKLNTKILDILKDAPGNPAARAQAQKELKQPIPEDVTTFDGIKDWVETTFRPMSMPKSPFPGNQDIISHVVSIAQDVSGTVTWSRKDTLQHTSYINARSFEQIVHEALDGGHTLDWLVDRVDVLVHSQSATAVPVRGILSYGEVVTTHTGERRMETLPVHKNRLKTSIKSILDSYYRPVLKQLDRTNQEEAAF